MKILLAASEAVPFCKTGGLADVVGALVQDLKNKKQDVRLVLPKYRVVDTDAFGLKPLSFALTLPLGDSFETVTVWEGKWGRGIPVYLIDAPKYFDREGLYQDNHGAGYTDNDDRYVLFSRAVLELAKAIDFRPDIIHCHDWQTGLIPAYLSTIYKYDGFFIPTSSVFSVHNIACQGIFPKNTLFTAGFSWADFTSDRLEFFDQMNFLKAGIVFSHMVSTVSPSYADEVKSDREFGRGMEGLLRSRAHDFFGILNGLDIKYWNPATDPYIHKQFSLKNLAARARCKSHLQKACGLPPESKSPLLGMVSRLDPQKGIDIILHVIEKFIVGGCQAVFLGHGNHEYVSAFKALQKKYMHQISFSAGFNEPLAHQIYAGADIFLMPSKFEPCGLSQMIAMRYGAVPVVTPVGGLKDTVLPFTSSKPIGLGFVSREVNATSYVRALDEAVHVYTTDPVTWKRLMKRCLSCPFQWAKSTEKYLNIYQLAVSRKQEK